MDDPEANDKDVKVKALDEDDIALLKTYGLGPYSDRIKSAEADVKRIAKEVNDICGIKESDTGLAPPSRWDLVSDKQAMQEEQPLQARGPPAHCGKPSRRCSRRSRSRERPAARSC
jgi:26S proteasome regulatory subunit T1